MDSGCYREAFGESDPDVQESPSENKALESLVLGVLESGYPFSAFTRDGPIRRMLTAVGLQPVSHVKFNQVAVKMAQNAMQGIVQALAAHDDVFSRLLKNGATLKPAEKRKDAAAANSSVASSSTIQLDLPVSTPDDSSGVEIVDGPPNPGTETRNTSRSSKRSRTSDCATAVPFVGMYRTLLGSYWSNKSKEEFEEFEGLPADYEVDADEQPDIEEPALTST